MSDQMDNSKSCEEVVETAEGTTVIVRDQQGWVRSMTHIPNSPPQTQQFTYDLPPQASAASTGCPGAA